VIAVRRFTGEERVLLYLKDFFKARDEYEQPGEVTQKGISTATLIPRKHLSRVLRRLQQRNFIEVRSSRVSGARQRMLCYIPTAHGCAEGERLARDVLEENVRVNTPQGMKDCKLKEVAGIIGKAYPVSFLVARIDDDGVLDVERPADDDGKAERIEVYKRALASVMSDGEVNPVEDRFLKELRNFLELTETDAERAREELITREGIEPALRLEVYEDALQQVTSDRVITEDERAVLEVLRKRLGISEKLHSAMLERIMERHRLSEVQERTSIEEVMLIFNDGRLVAHISRSPSQAMDQDVFAGMLTAVQSFLKDVYGSRTGGGLRDLTYGGYHVLLEVGESCTLAVTSRGHLSEYSRAYAGKSLVALEARYRAMLSAWNGSVSALTGLPETLRQMFGFDVEPAPAAASPEEKGPKARAAAKKPAKGRGKK
jgi:DNA-binding MarR family transcriptional regulator